MKQHSEKFPRKRKFLLALPVLIIPFLTMAFWATGGGKGKRNSLILSNLGLNPKLPDPKLKDDRSLNKLSFYELAQRDSQKLKSELENDKYRLRVRNDSGKYDLSQLKTLTENFSNRYHQSYLNGINGLNTSADTTLEGSKSAEENLIKKLNLLENEINKPVEKKKAKKDFEKTESQKNVNFSSDVDRLENMMQALNNKEEGDPEISKLDSVLDKIIDIQHPERIKEEMEKKANESKKNVFPVSPQEKVLTVSLLGDKSNAKENGLIGFYRLNDENNFDSCAQNSIAAVIHESQTIVSGSVIKLRLLNDININGNLIPKGIFVFGLAKLNGERLTIEINSISYNNSIYPVQLEVYDLDGLTGIYVPGAFARDVAKQSANSSIQSVGISTLDPSLGAKAATAGMNAAKDLLSKKIKTVRVTVKAGYQVLLKDNQKQ
jgi:conjugative transposon TraM protein